MHAAVAAGCYPDIEAAAAAMGKVRRAAYTPDAASSRAYDALYAEYDDAARLLRPRRRTTSCTACGHPAGERDRWSAAVERRCAREVCALHAELVRNDLVAWTSGNVSARVPGEELMVIKASGVSFDELTPEAMVVCDLHGTVVEGDLSPSSDTFTHAYVYREMPAVGGIAHTHSPYATAWAARAEPIPCVLTAMADEFGGAIPVGPFALIGGEEIGHGIVATLGRPAARPRC